MRFGMISVGSPQSPQLSQDVVEEAIAAEKKLDPTLDFRYGRDFVNLRQLCPNQNARSIAQTVKIFAVLIVRAADDRAAKFLEQLYVLVLIGFRNRLIVLIQWAWSYITYERGARLITGDTTLPGWRESERPSETKPQVRR